MITDAAENINLCHKKEKDVTEKVNFRERRRFLPSLPCVTLSGTEQARFAGISLHAGAFAQTAPKSAKSLGPCTLGLYGVFSIVLCARFFSATKEQR